MIKRLNKKSSTDASLGWIVGLIFALLILFGMIALNIEGRLPLVSGLMNCEENFVRPGYCELKEHPTDLNNPNPNAMVLASCRELTMPTRFSCGKAAKELKTDKSKLMCCSLRNPYKLTIQGFSSSDSARELLDSYRAEVKEIAKKLVNSGTTSGTT